MSLLPGYSNFRRLGSGGLGDVFYAIRDSTRTEVAVKVLRDWSDQSAAWERAGREFNALRRLKEHAHVVALEDTVAANGVPHLIMEFAHGGSVSALAKQRGGPLTLGEVVLIGSHTAAALEASHGEGIAHLDIKPQNLLITRFGEVKVCDFGIAALAGSDRYRGQANEITYQYASPEQIKGFDAGGSSDVFSLGLTLTHLLVGPAWSRSAQDHRGERPLPWLAPPGLDPTIVTRVDALLSACLRTDPIRRPSAADVHLELEAIANALGSVRVRKLQLVPPELGPMIMAAPSPRPGAGRPGTSAPGRPGTRPTTTARPGPATGADRGRTATGPARRPGATTGRRGNTTSARPRTAPRRRGGAGAAIVAVVVFGGVVAGGAVLIPRLASRDDGNSRDPVATTVPVVAATTVAAAASANPTQAPAAAPAAEADANRTAAADAGTSMLDGLVAADAAAVNGLVGSWAPQVGSGRPGPTLTASALATTISAARDRYGAVVFVTGEYAGPVEGMYIAVVPSPMASAADAIGWCRSQRLSNDECYARLVTRDPSISPIIVYQ